MDKSVIENSKDDGIESENQEADGSGPVIKEDNEIEEEKVEDNILLPDPKPESIRTFTESSVEDRA